MPCNSDGYCTPTELGYPRIEVACAMAQIICASDKDFLKVLRRAKIDWKECGTTPEKVAEWVLNHRDKDRRRRLREQEEREQKERIERAELGRLKKKYDK